MKVRNILFPIVFIVFISYAAEGLQTEISLKLATYGGGRYIPSKEYDTNSYHSESCFEACSILHPTDNLEGWLEFRYDDQMFARKLNLYRAGIKAWIKSFYAACQLDRIELGVYSRIYKLDLRDSYYSRPVLIDYRFDGIETGIKSGLSNYAVKLGGNDFNSSICSASLKRKSRNLLLELLYLYVNRGADYNLETHHLGLEFVFSMNSFRIYETAVYLMVPELDQSVLKNLIELEYIGSEHIRSGINLLYESLDFSDSPDWSFQSYLTIKTGRFENTVISSYTESNRYLDKYLLRSIKLLNLIRFGDHLKLGLNTSHTNCSYDSYYEIGIQAQADFSLN